MKTAVRYFLMVALVLAAFAATAAPSDNLSAHGRFCEEAARLASNIVQLRDKGAPKRWVADKAVAIGVSEGWTKYTAVVLRIIDMVYDNPGLNPAEAKVVYYVKCLNFKTLDQALEPIR